MCHVHLSDSSYRPFRPTNAVIQAHDLKRNGPILIKTGNQAQTDAERRIYQNIRAIEGVPVI